MQLFSSNIIETKDTEKMINIVCNLLSVTNTENNPDLKILETPKGKHKIPIEELKRAREWINIKPYQHKTKLLIIKKAEYLGTDSQNALLKTLEEPPSYAVIVLITSSIKSLLDTVISRCKIIKLKQENSGNIDLKLSLNSIINSKISVSLDNIELITKEIDGKDEAIQIINSLEQQLRENKFNLDPNLFVKLQDAKKELETTNVNVKIALYKLILDLKS